jgi:uncharacterized protein (DUF4415 family)
MKKVAAEAYRDIDFTRARRGAVIKVEAGKTKISIRLDNRVLDHFRSVVRDAGEGNYQTLINDALVAYIQQKSMLEGRARRSRWIQACAPRCPKGAAGACASCSNGRLGVKFQ